jgi:hypothetical protein
MVSVIGEYPTEAAATRAVRALERDFQMSIQDMVIADKSRRVWRRFHPRGGRTATEEASFLVVMRGDADAIERARALLN